MRALPTILGGLAMAATPSPAAAQGAPPQDESPVIVVTGQPLADPPAEPAYGVQTIDRARIVAAASGRLEIVLTDAGVTQFRRSDSRAANPTAQGVSLRALGGNASSRALVTLDGVPMNDPFFGHVPFPALDPQRIGTVRVRRGGGAGPFGAGALAGVIELGSLTPQQAGSARAALAINDRGESEASAGIAGALGTGWAALDLRHDRGDGFWTTPAAERVAASVPARFSAWSGQARALVPLAPEVELQARIAAFDDRRTLRFAGADSAASGQDASLRLVASRRWQVEALAYVQARDFANRVISATRFTPVLDQGATPATGLGGKLELRPPLGERQMLRLGVDYRQASGFVRETAFNAATGRITARRRAGGQVADLGVYAEHDRTLGPVLLTGGVRLDRGRISDGFFEERASDGAVLRAVDFADRADWQLGWRGGARWQAGPALALRAAAYRGFRQPTLNELYRPFAVFPVLTEANATLDNEVLRGIEAGLDWRPAAGVEMTLTAFDNRLNGAIANLPIGPNLRRRENLPAIRARGVEAVVATTRGVWRLDAAGYYAAARIVGEGASAALDGNRPAQSPRFTGALTLAWQPDDRRRLSLRLHHVSAQYEADDEADRLPPATTLDAFARWPLLRDLALVARAENLTDARIVTRQVGSSTDLGAPRTFWLGLAFAR
ncbi:MAG: TonB-dependent receptor [Citromicrobium sp.]|nr:MAG: TonB-dependent receptor [Citromicrobium sp.]